MAITEPARAVQAGSERRFLLHDISWQTYQRLLTDLGDGPIRLSYDRGDLELMAPSNEHEKYKKLIARLLEALTEELNIPMSGEGSTTWLREDLARGVEPDECSYICNEPLIRNKETIDLASDPPPDLVIEIEISRSSLDRRGIYAALGVPELWCYDGQSLRVYQLRADGQYEPSEQSASFPFLPLEEFERFLQRRGTMDQTSLVRSFRTWVRDQVAPRYQADAPAGTGG